MIEFIGGVMFATGFITTMEIWAAVLYWRYKDRV